MDDTATKPREIDWQAEEAGRLLEAHLSTGDMHRTPTTEDHRRVVLAMVARAWEAQPSMALGQLLHRAATAAGAMDSSQLHDLSLLAGLGVMRAEQF